MFDRLKAPISLLLVAGLAACGSAGDDAAAGQMLQGSAGPLPDGAELPADHPPISQLPPNHPGVESDGTPAPGMRPHAEDARTGTVLEAMNAGGYTYALMDFGGDEIWVAGPRSTIQEGDEITVSGLMGMTNFYARSLDRTFDNILFASLVSRGG